MYIFMYLYYTFVRIRGGGDHNNEFLRYTGHVGSAVGASGVTHDEPPWR